MKEEKDFNAGFFHCFRSERIRCTDYKRWCVEKRNGGDIWMAEKFKVALGKETESLADFHRADRGFQAGRAQDLRFYTCLFK